MGGTQSKQKYVATEGSRIKKRLLTIPLASSLSDVTYSELIDHVKREAGTFGNEKLTYKSSKIPVLGMSIPDVKKVDFFGTYYRERVEHEALFGSCGRAFSFIETRRLVPWLNPSFLKPLLLRYVHIIFASHVCRINLLIQKLEC
ncbi:hypothetical protein HanIR_Chr01g0041041 [Helianthus annuus]|nr:hypothetical protein HanIR_Chr01g0041041 [Helianthus annuus]